MDQTSHMSNQCNDILIEILKRMLAPDILTLRSTSKSFNKISTNQDVWKHLFDSTFGKAIAPSQYEEIFRGYYLESIDL